MKYLIYFFSIILLFVINLGLFDYLSIFRQVPNLLFLFALCFTFEKNRDDFLFVGFLSGLLLDFYSTGFFGAFTFGFLLVFTCAHLIADKVAVEFSWKSLSLSLLITLLSFILIEWFYGLLAFKFNWVAQHDSLKVVLSTFVVSLIYNFLLLYPVYKFYIFLKKTLNELEIKRRGVIR